MAKPKAPAVKPFYPELPETGHPLFWLAVWFREIAQLAALTSHIAACHCTKTSRNDVLMHSLYNSQQSLRDTTRQSSKYAAEEGILLFCWEGTTALETEGGAA